MKIRTKSYKPTEFKRGYLRVNGAFQKEAHRSKNHRYFVAEVQDGDEIDARGSVFMGGDGRSRYQAPRGRWLRFEIANDELIAKDFDGNTVTIPSWVKLED